MSVWYLQLEIGEVKQNEISEILNIGNVRIDAKITFISCKQP